MSILDNLTPEQAALFSAGWLDGYADRQPEIDTLEEMADRYYRAAFADERRPRHVEQLTYLELEQRRRISDPPPRVTVEQALASWGIDTEPATATTTESAPTGSGRTNRISRRRTMSTRTITGNLATDPEAVQAGRVQIVKLRVLENTGEYRQGEWHQHDDATTHFVEAKFELGENALATLHRGDAVIVVGYEHTLSWGDGETKRYGRVIDADAIGPNLARATAAITRTIRDTTTP